MGPNLHFLKLVSRAAVWKPVPDTYSVGFGLFMACAVASLTSDVIYEYAASDAGRFVPYGLNAVLVVLVVSMIVAALFAPGEARMPFVVSQLALSVPIFLVHAGFAFGTSRVAGGTASSSWIAWSGHMAFYLLTVLWWIGATAVVLRSLLPTRRRVVMRAVSLYLATLVAVYALPYEPVFRAQNFDVRSANLWEYIPTLLSSNEAATAADPPRVNRDEVEFAQPKMLEAQIAALTDQVKGKSDVFALGIAGWGDQKIFTREVTGALDSLARVFPLDGRVIRLINNPDTMQSAPVASKQNFSAAVRAVAQRMDREEDVFLLFVTSHGSPRGVGLVLNGAMSTTLTPQNVVDVLDQEGIKNRIVIVSACYAGIFIKPLANDNTIILTAADETHTSFGCSDDREWTHFGDAFFNQSLRSAVDLQEAFANTRALIAASEAREGIPASNPQGHFGKALMDKLAPIYAQRNQKPVRAAARE